MSYFSSGRWLCSSPAHSCALSSSGRQVCHSLCRSLSAQHAVQPAQWRLLVPSIRLVTWFCHFCIPNSPHTLLVLLLHSAVTFVQLAPSWTLEEPATGPSSCHCPKSEVLVGGPSFLSHSLLSPQALHPHPPPSVDTLGLHLASAHMLVGAQHVLGNARWGLSRVSPRSAASWCQSAPAHRRRPLRS